jgi:hypothetical protein
MQCVSVHMVCGMRCIEEDPCIRAHSRLPQDVYVRGAVATSQAWIAVCGKTCPENINGLECGFPARPLQLVTW